MKIVEVSLLPMLRGVVGWLVDFQGKPWFHVLAQICRNSDKTLKTEYKTKLTKKFVDFIWAVRGVKGQQKSNFENGNFSKVISDLDSLRKSMMANWFSFFYIMERKLFIENINKQYDAIKISSLRDNKMA